MIPPEWPLSKTHTVRRLILTATLVLFYIIRWEWELRSMTNYGPLPSLSPSLPEKTLRACTQEESVWPKPNDLTPYKYQDVLQAEKILAFIISKLDEVNAPATLMFGTALHEYRNGTNVPCLRPKYQDKDFDMAVFAEHFHYIITWKNEILEKFGWTLLASKRSTGRLYLKILPAPPSSNYFQIDVYGFVCSTTSNRTFFPWDSVTIATDAFLPLRKHKLILLQNDTAGTNAKYNGTVSIDEPDLKNQPGFYMPHDPPCLLHNIYGSDYMTPKSGISSQAKWGGDHGRPAYDNPKCTSTLTAWEKHELERQQMFCSRGVPDSRTMVGFVSG